MQTAGLLDLQVNGYAGVDFNDASLTAEALDHALHAMLAAGVTRCLPTLITATEPVLEARFAALDQAASGSRLAKWMVPGWHLEGPFLNPAPGFRGCHPAEAMVRPDPRMLARLGKGLRRPILIVTLAAELDGAEETIRWCADQGKLAAIGHSDARADAVARAVAAGARMSTHLGNGMPQQLHKVDNPIMAQLAEDKLVAGLIADGIHLPPFAVRAMIRAKGPGRAVLVTDAVAAAGAAPGRYGFAGMEIDLAEDGSVRLPGSGTLAGSGLTMDRAVRNLVAWGIAPAAVALRMAGSDPAALLAPVLAAHGIDPAPGWAEWTEDLHIVASGVADVVYRRHPA